MDADFRASRRCTNVNLPTILFGGSEAGSFLPNAVIYLDFDSRIL